MYDIWIVPVLMGSITAMTLLVFGLLVWATMPWFPLYIFRTRAYYLHSIPIGMELKAGIVGNSISADYISVDRISVESINIDKITAGTDRGDVPWMP